MHSVLIVQHIELLIQSDSWNCRAKCIDKEINMQQLLFSNRNLSHRVLSKHVFHHSRHIVSHICYNLHHTCRNSSTGPPKLSSRSSPTRPNSAAANNNDLPTTREEEQQEEDTPTLTPTPTKSQPHQRVSVPWNFATTFVIMMLWLLGFWMAAYVVVPSFLGFLGITAASGSNGRIAALKHLILDIIQLVFSIGLLKTTLREYDTTNLGLFKFQLFPVSSWLPSLAAGVASFPLIDWVHRRMVHLIHGNMDTDGSVLRGAVEQIASGSDWASWAAWFGVLALCAPLWEEVMFRGFLLPSLGRYLPPWAAIVCTSFIFAGVHFSKEGFLPLVLLGVVFGAVYIKTRNLLPAVLLHSLWNIALLGQIITASGIV
jgi:uncharacterized protein